MIKIDGESLSIKDVVSVSRDFAIVGIEEKAIEKIKKSRKMVEEIISRNEKVYGVTTGVGELANERIPQKDVEKLQHNLIRSHSCGVGEPLTTEIVRAMILLRANSLAKGYSGIRIETVQRLVAMLNKKIHPVIPRQGSVGASGDLVPLAHMALALIGEGKVELNGKKMRAMEAMKEVGMKPTKLVAKEGLALINGTQMMTAMGAMAIHDARLLLKNAQIAGTMSLEALKGTDQAFRKELHEARPHKGQVIVARNLWKLTRGSEIIESHKNCPKVQDAYTLRCLPQVLGAIRDVIGYAGGIVEIEMNSATDNPLIFDNGESISGGDFHGEQLAFALDFLAIALSEIGNFSERRIARLVDSHLSGLPPFLTEKSGINSGFMLPQYVAASLASENKTLSHPAVVDSIPTSANQEDHQSMGSISGWKALKILENSQKIIAIELLTAAQALEFHDLEPGNGIKAAHKMIRKEIPKLEEDRVMHGDIQKIIKMVKNGNIIREVESIIGGIE